MSEHGLNVSKHALYSGTYYNLLQSPPRRSIYEAKIVPLGGPKYRNGKVNTRYYMTNWWGIEFLGIYWWEFNWWGIKLWELNWWGIELVGIELVGN